MRFIKEKPWFGCMLAALPAGCVNGLLGAGGGMLLVPLLCVLTTWPDRKIFAASVCIILPITLVSLSLTAIGQPLPWKQALPYLLGSLLGGIFTVLFGRKIPTGYLHKALGILILWGGIRYLC